MALFKKPPTTHPSLLVRLRDQMDASAWNEFVSIYSPIIFSFCKKHGISNHDSQDICQETMVRVIQLMPEFKYSPERGHFRSWLKKVTLNRMVDYFRAKKNEKSLDNLPPLESPALSTQWEELFNQKVLQSALEIVRNQTISRHWGIFEAVWLNHQAPAEVAKKFGMEIANVYLIKSRVLQALNKQVELLAEDTLP